jgi:hypothetical protein
VLVAITQVARLILLVIPRELFFLSTFEEAMGIGFQLFPWIGKPVETISAKRCAAIAALGFLFTTPAASASMARTAASDVDEKLHLACA